MIYHYLGGSWLSWVQIIIGTVIVSEHLGKISVLSRVFNTRILDVTNYANQDYMHVNYTVFAWIWPNSDRGLVNHCALPSIGQTWVLAQIGAVH
jgi:hypothetical protein